MYYQFMSTGERAPVDFWSFRDDFAKKASQFTLSILFYVSGSEKHSLTKLKIDLVEEAPNNLIH